MSIHTRKEKNVYIIELDGRLALGGPVDDFRAKWTEALNAGEKFILINLSRVTMMDSSGIGTMIRCHSAINAAGGKLRLVGANNTVRQAFKVTRLDKVFEFHEDEQSAIAATA
jgi:anti-sigma B factor antagonist